VAHNGVAALSLLLERGADARVVTGQGWSALQLCVASGSLDAFERLLPRVADVDWRTTRSLQPDGSPGGAVGETALHLAASYAQERMVRALLPCPASCPRCGGGVCPPPLRPAAGGSALCSGWCVSGSLHSLRQAVAGGLR